MQRLVRRTAFWDACLLIVIFLGGSVIGARYIDAFQKTGAGEFGQPEFGAAVALACGRGFVNPSAPSPALQAFLLGKTDSVSCDVLPAAMKTEAPNFTQRLYRYLMVAVATEWKVSGVSWSKLTPLFGLVFALTLCAAYGIFRLAGGPLIGMLGVLPLAVSAHNLGMLPELRDYAKAPFILALMLLTARLAIPPYSRIRSLVLSGLFGLTLGLGFGFRNDILIALPPFVIVVALLLPVKWREEIGVKAACLALAAVMFVISGWPILRAYQAGSNTGHVAVLGLMTPFDAPLAVTRPPYAVGTHYLDGFGGAVIRMHAQAQTGRDAAYLEPDYEKAAFTLIGGEFRHFPADIFVRGVASTLRVFDFPMSDDRSSPSSPAGITSPSILKFYEGRKAFLSELSGLGPLLAVIALVVIGASSLPGAVALLLFTLYYCGYPAVQFHIRHYFHLEFIAWWALLFLLAAGGRAVRARVQRAPFTRPLKLRAVGALATIAVMVVAILVPLSILRVYQQSHVPGLLASYLNAHRTPLSTSRSIDGDQIAIAVNGLWEGRKAGDGLLGKYLIVEFSAAGCDAANVPVTLKYDAIDPSNDFSTTTRVAIDPRGPTYQFSPVFYYGHWTHFAHVSMPSGYDACLKSVSVVDDASRVPMPLEFMMTPNAADTSWFQRLANWENRPTSADPLVVARPVNLVAPTPSRLSGVARLQPDLMTGGVVPAAAGRGWIGSVTASVPEAHLLKFPPQDVPAGAVLRATGVLRRGGLQIGFIDGELWVDMQNVDTPGPFTVLVRAPRAGRYGALVTDFSTRPWRIESSTLLRRASRYLATWLLTDDFDLHNIEWLNPGV